jgi:prepilin-type processing-associated H-X9-DG protein
MQCSNKVKQLSLALHNYHDTYDSFPAGGSPFYTNNVANLGMGMRHSVFFTILPFCEQQPLYDRYVSAAQSMNKSTGNPVYIWTFDDTNYPALREIVYLSPAPLRCPSETVTPPTNTYGYSNYAYCKADWAPYFYPDEPTPRSLFSCGQWFGMNFITDGTSNTAVFSEKAMGQAGNRKVIGSMAYVSGAKLKDGTTTLPITATNCSVAGCLAAQAGRDYTSAVTDPDISGSLQPGRAWLDNAPPRTAFCTILPPNSITCCSSSKNENTRVIASASSYHPGGVQVGLADGSVRFVSDTINAKTTGGVDYCVVIGVSPFGVWGALGTPNDGESTSP